MSDNPFDGVWAIVEIMGHRRLAGRVSEQEFAGSGFVRLDIPSEDVTDATQLYSPAAIYAITPTTEEVARRFAANCRPEPATTWDLRLPARVASVASGDSPVSEDIPF